MLIPKVLKPLTRKRVLTMEWVAGENPKELLSLSRGISDKITEASEKQKLEAKTRLLDLVYADMLTASNYVDLKFFYGKEVLCNLTSSFRQFQTVLRLFQNLRIMVLYFNIESHCCPCYSCSINLPTVIAFEKLGLCLLGI